MNDFTMMAVIEAKGQDETLYLRKIDLLANDVKDSRDMIAAFLEDHPEMEEFISGDKENGYEYIPAKEKVAPEELVESLKPNSNGSRDDICDYDGPVSGEPDYTIEVSVNGS